ncbi:MAG: hypothetical protein KAR47_20330 [Planctomycetes bacterium]|nr:hypothetical protein [Planctomycetota bacterium]
MKLPEVENAQRYIGLYVVDFGERCSVGFTSQEVAELLESEQFQDITVYKVHRAYPDGRMELKGVRREIFHLEMGMFFYAAGAGAAESDFERLVALAQTGTAPSRAKVHLAGRQGQGEKDSRSEEAGPGDSEAQEGGPVGFAVALIYPAEYDDQFCRWLLDAGYRHTGSAEGGIEAVQRYYDRRWDVLRSHQVFPQASYTDRTGEELIAATRIAVQR